MTQKPLKKMIKLQNIIDMPDGNLFIAEAERHVPFPVRRVYFMTHLANPNAIRGKHAHRRLCQAIFAVNGSFELLLDNGVRSEKVRVDNPSRGVLLSPMLWHTMSKFSYDCVILVLADDYYDESDYIRDYRTFRSITGRKRSS